VNLGTLTGDRFNLARFLVAQEGVWPAARAEIASGRKRGHWMWFIFPQLAGLGRSAMADRYAIGSLEEAQAYLAHPVLGARLREAVATLQDVTGTTADVMFGPVDAMKLRSSLTLYIRAGAPPLFSAALARWFGGQMDERTLALLSEGGAESGPVDDGTAAPAP